MSSHESESLEISSQDFLSWHLCVVVPRKANSLNSANQKCRKRSAEVLSARRVALTIFRPSLISSCLSLLSCDVNVESDTKYIFTKTHISKYTYDIVTCILLLNCRF